MEAGKSRGKLLNNAFSASTPPAEVPITMMVAFRHKNCPRVRVYGAGFIKISSGSEPGAVSGGSGKFYVFYSIYYGIPDCKNHRRRGCISV
jgi:hypothetical protein